jgi:hypothetical protein
VNLEYYLDIYESIQCQEAPLPDISAELPEVLLEKDEYDFQVMTDKLEPDFEELASAALANTGIDTADQLRAARVAADATVAVPIWQFDQLDGQRLVEAEPDKIV